MSQRLVVLWFDVTLDLGVWTLRPLKVAFRCTSLELVGAGNLSLGNISTLVSV